MKNFTITTYNTGQLPTDKDIKEFFDFMQKEYPEYIEIEKQEVQAHNEGDLGWFIGEFINYKNSVKGTSRSFNHPKKSAYKLAQQMKQFLTRTEETAYSETNPQADHDRTEVVRQIDWQAFNKIIEQLEFCYKHDKKYKGVYWGRAAGLCRFIRL